jgi:hypothetical protein
MTETLIEGVHPFPSFTFLPNPNLVAETAHDWEAGINLKYDNVFRAGDRLRATLEEQPDGVLDDVARRHGVRCVSSSIFCRPRQRGRRPARASLRSGPTSSIGDRSPSSFTPRTASSKRRRRCRRGARGAAISLFTGKARGFRAALFVFGWPSQPWHVNCLPEGRSSTYLPEGMASLGAFPYLSEVSFSFRHAGCGRAFGLAD